MKYDNIEIGAEYEIGAYGERGIVVAKDPAHEHRVYSGARWDGCGHLSTGKRVAVVKISTDEAARVIYQRLDAGEDITADLDERAWLTTAQIKRPWSAVAAERQEAADEQAAADRRLACIRDALGDDAVTWDYIPGIGARPGRYSRQVVVVRVETLERLLGLSSEAQR